LCYGNSDVTKATFRNVGKSPIVTPHSYNIQARRTGAAFAVRARLFVREAAGARLEVGLGTRVFDGSYDGVLGIKIDCKLVV
jgi:hypothetical protein